ncbi:MAG: TonB-dependent receptor [Maricaulaceae bacterium]|jgi:iron complex outermembrane receptor protein
MSYREVSPSRLAIALATAAFGATSGAYAQQDNEDVIVVTGSYIAGTPEDAALPVDVISSQTLERQGIPSNVDLIKALTTVGATFAGDANPLGASRVQGAASINLRGLGNARTLVLLNGRRLSPITSGTQTLIDTNSLPMMAVSRVEILEDGGAATYGSDAIAGVVNFITSDDFEGLDLTGTYSIYDGSDGDLNARARWGFGNDNTNVVLGAGYQHRSQLSVQERDWAFRPYLENPTGWTTSGNPGLYRVASTSTEWFVDPGCEALGGELTPLGIGSRGGAPYCLNHYIGFENLVDEQHAFQLFSQVNSDVNEHTQLHIDAFYSQINVPEVATVGSSPVLNPPTTMSTGGPGAGIVPGYFFIPATNPGVVDLVGAYSAGDLGLSADAYSTLATTGVNARLSWRAAALGGNPAFDHGAKLDHREFTIYRASGGFTGDNVLGFNIDWDVNGTFSSAEADSSGTDVIVSRFQYALRGLGGPGCTPDGANPATSTPGMGPCQYYNPFSNAVAQSALTGETNPGFTGTQNDADLTRWLFNPGGSITTNELLTFDAVFSGEVEGLELPGGPVGWAAGAQYRRSRILVNARNDLGNAAINPCVDEGQPLSSCPDDPRGVTGLFGPVVERDFDQEVRGLFGELSLPITDRLQVQAAVRTESHDAGDTTNPKIAVRWEPVDGFALRASAQSTYRAPVLSSLDPNIVQTITARVGLVRVPYDVGGNPDLQAETSDNFNVGVIVNRGGLSATVDYWTFNLQDQIIREDVPSMVSTLFPSGGDNCGDPAFADLEARFTFVGGGACVPGTTGISDIDRVGVSYFNGPEVEASGVDVSLLYDLPQPIAGGDVTLGLDTTYNIEYQIAATEQFGVTLSDAFDAVGLLNAGIDPRALPQWRAQFSANYNNGPHNIRWLTHYVDSMRDQRAGTGASNDPLNPVSGFPAGTIVEGGVNIDSFITHDAHYTWDVRDDSTLTFSVINLTDEDPPLTRDWLSYDAFTATPLGRVFKVGIRQSF